MFGAAWNKCTEDRSLPKSVVQFLHDQLLYRYSVYSAARMTFVSFSCSSARDPALLSHVLLTDEAGFICDRIVSCQSQRV